MCLARHVQSIQNNKFAMPLQYLKENIKDEVDFLPSDKHLSLLQTDTIIVVCGQACQIAPNNKFAITLQYFEIENSDEVDFLHVDKHESFL